MSNVDDLQTVLDAVNKAKKKKAKPGDKQEDKAEDTKGKPDIIQVFGKIGDAVDERYGAVPSGIMALDIAIGIGGYPRGRIVEVFGSPGCGKSLLSLRSIASVQQSGGLAALVDAEKKASKSFMQMLGVNVDTLLYSQESRAKEVFELVEALAATDRVNIIVIDSIAALICEQQIEGAYGDPNVAAMAKFLSQSLPKLNDTIARSKTTLICVNQERSKPMVMFGSKTDTTGGVAVKFYSTVRIDVSKGDPITAKVTDYTGKTEECKIGHTVRCFIEKNQVAPPFKKAVFDLYYTQIGEYDAGVDYAKDLLFCGLYTGVITKNGSSWFIIGDEKFNGEAAAIKHIRATPSLYTTIHDEMLKVAGAAAAKEHVEIIVSKSEEEE